MCELYYCFVLFVMNTKTCTKFRVQLQTSILLRIYCVAQQCTWYICIPLDNQNNRTDSSPFMRIHSGHSHKCHHANAKTDTSSFPIQHEPATGVHWDFIVGMQWTASVSKSLQLPFTEFLFARCKALLKNIVISATEFMFLVAFACVSSFCLCSF